MTWVIVASAVALVALLLLATWAYQTATRLDRLHVRYDLSWQALDAALARRAVVARAVATDAYGPGTPAARRLAWLADAAERASRTRREVCENELTSEIGQVDPALLPTPLIAELADAEARVLLARRFHNDAVRDTLSLRERRAIRWLRLGGTAPLPTYFEIVERPELTLPGEQRRTGPRTSARVVLLDELGTVLLFCGSDPASTVREPPRWWFTVGGEVDEGEQLRAAACRELAEETGLRVAPEHIIGPVWRREAVINFNGAVIRSHEYFFVHRTDRFEPSDVARTPLEMRYIHGHRWCDADDIHALVAGGEAVYPVQLAELLPQAHRLATAPGGHASVGDPQQALAIR
ncbi:MAG: NUDIX hydrolase [Mycobacterium sp.]